MQSITAFFQIKLKVPANPSSIDPDKKISVRVCYSWICLRNEKKLLNKKSIDIQTQFSTNIFLGLIMISNSRFFQMNFQVDKKME